MEKELVVWKKLLKNWWTTNFVMVMTIVVDGLPWQSTYQVRMHCVFPIENSWLILLLLLFLLITKRIVVVLLSDWCWLVWTAQNVCLFLVSCVFADVVLLHRCSVLCSAGLGAWHTTNTKKWNGTVVDVVVAFCVVHRWAKEGSNFRSTPTFLLVCAFVLWFGSHGVGNGWRRKKGLCDMTAVHFSLLSTVRESPKEKSVDLKGFSFRPQLV